MCAAQEDEKFMRRALELAKKGEGWVSPNPMVGAVIVKDGRIIGEGWHEKYGQLHAERNALAHCSQSPEDGVMYVTLEPCQMCSGALVQSRIDEVVIGCMNPKAGCAGSVMNLLQIDGFNHQVKITQGVLEEECSEMLSTFFKELREKKKQAKMLKKQEAERLAGQQVQEEDT